MTPQVFAIRSTTPVTEALVRSILTRTGQPGLAYDDNRMAYTLRCWELRHPILTRLFALLRFGPQIALARDVLSKEHG